MSDGKFGAFRLPTDNPEADAPQRTSLSLGVEGAIETFLVVDGNTVVVARNAEGADPALTPAQHVAAQASDSSTTAGTAAAPAAVNTPERLADLAAENARLRARLARLDGDVDRTDEGAEKRDAAEDERDYPFAKSVSIDPAVNATPVTTAPDNTPPTPPSGQVGAH